MTEYEADIDESSPHIQYFWESLRQMDQTQRAAFVNFVSARSRLPNSVDEFPMNFKIQGPKPGALKDPDSHLPHSQTCFFTLSLPFYSSQEVWCACVRACVRVHARVCANAGVCAREKLCWSPQCNQHTSDQASNTPIVR